MEIKRIITSPLETNTYIVINDRKAFVVDPGGEAEKILKIVDDAGAELEAVLLTHGHSDHICDAGKLQRAGASVFIHQKDSDKINSYKNLGFSLNIKNDNFTPDVLLNGGEFLNICGLKVKTIHTPGHSEGGACYIVGDWLFSGDTLFYNSYGRTDFYDGNFGKLKNSIINKLFNLPHDYTVYPGHGDATSLDFERMNNMINYQ